MSLLALPGAFFRFSYLLPQREPILQVVSCLEQRKNQDGHRHAGDQNAKRGCKPILNENANGELRDRRGESQQDRQEQQAAHPLQRPVVRRDAVLTASLRYLLAVLRVVVNLFFYVDDDKCINGNQKTPEGQKAREKTCAEIGRVELKDRIR